VTAAAAPSGTDRERIRELLWTAEGYAVYDRRGRRVGAFIELVGLDGEGIAIRHEGVFLWRRRVLPLTIVARVLPEQRALVLDLDRRALDRPNAAPSAVGGTFRSTDEDAGWNRHWQGRVARYVSAAEREGDQGKDGHDREQALDIEGPRTSAPAQPWAEPTRRSDHTADRHLLFISSSRGYELVERDGPPPAASGAVTVPERRGRFRVVKLASSPLPNDPRICAYLERIE
jgi:hypothetical protein